MTTATRTSVFTGLTKRQGPGLVPVLVFALVAVLVLPAVFVVAVASLREGAALPFDPVPLTFANYRAFLLDPFTYRLLLNTVLYAGASLIIGMPLAVLFAWLVERSDLPYKNLVAAALFVPLAIPGALTAMGWTLMLAPRTGFVNVWLRGLLGWDLTGLSIEGPFNIYSFSGLIFVTGISIVPSMFLMISATFQNMDAQLEEAGRTSGATVWSVTHHITLPVLAPSLVAAGIYYIIVLIEMFEIPLVIGLNANYPVLSTYVFELVRSEQQAPQYGVAAVFGMLAIGIGISLAAFYARFGRHAYKYAVVTGRRLSPRPVHLGSWKLIALGSVTLYVMVGVVTPLLALLWTSVSPPFMQPSVAALQNTSLSAYRLAFLDRRWTEAIVNTIILVLSASTANVVLGTLVSWVVIRTRFEWIRWLDALAFLPRAIPHVVLALGIFLLLIRTPLYATIWIIVVAHTITYLPFSVRVINAALLQIHKELEEAARANGAGTVSTLILIVLPLMRHALLNSWLWVAAHSVRDFTYTLMLGASTNTVIAVLLWQSWANDQVERTSAMAVMLLVALLLIVVPARYRLRKFGTM